MILFGALESEKVKLFGLQKKITLDDKYGRWGQPHTEDFIIAKLSLLTVSFEIFIFRE